MIEQQKRMMQAFGNLWFLILAGWAMSLSLPMRRNSGKHHVGTIAGIALVILGLYAVFTQSQEIAFLCLIFVFAAMCHGMGVVKRRLLGVIQHTHYDGEPYLAQKVFFCKDEHRAKLFGEPLLVLATALCMVQFAPAAALYFIIGAFAMIAVQSHVDRQQQQRIDEMHNGRIENEHLMAHFSQQRNRGRR